MTTETPEARRGVKRKTKNNQYLHYVPEFDELVVMEKRYKDFWRDAFKPGAKGKTKHVFIMRGDFGFRNIVDFT